MDNNAIVTVYASDLLTDAVSNCNNPLHYSIYLRYQVESGEVIPQSTDQDSIVLNCYFCGRNDFLVYVWDDQYNPDSVQPDGTIGGPNYSFCHANVLIHDFFSSCNCDYSSIGGIIKTQADQPLKGVYVHLTGTYNLHEITPANGQYYFGYVSAGLVTAHLDTLPLTGISTLDIVLITRHILGIQPLIGPYNRIAADVNHDNEITIADVLWLKRLLLGVDSTFTNNTSWRFVPEDYQFPVPTNPWFESFPEALNITAISDFVLSANFVAIKIGDVNGSASATLLPPDTETLDPRGAAPERTIQPFCQPAPEYGAAIGMATDTCAPVIECIDGFAGTLIPLPPGSDLDGDGYFDEGKLTLFADDFIENGISNCGSTLHYSMYRLHQIETGAVVPNAGDPDSLVLGCDDCGLLWVRIYAWDDQFNPEAMQPDGTVGGPNYSYCETYVLAQDNFSVCNCEFQSEHFSGIIETEESEGVSGVSVQMSGAETYETSTGQSGQFNLYASSYFWQTNTYTITPVLDVNDKNGITNFDLVLISRHIMTIQPLGSPYKIIAADVNNDQKITVADLIHLRRLILDLDSGFVYNTSWRFVRADYFFPVDSNPWFEVFPESRTGTGTSFEQEDLDFVAIKIGDVNSSASATLLPPDTETPDPRGAAPERTLQPFCQPAPEYGAAIGMATDTCAPVIECLSGLTFTSEPAEPGNGDGIIATLQGFDLVESSGSTCSNNLQYSVYRSDEIVAGLVVPGPNQDSVSLNCGQDCEGTVILRVYVWDDNFNPDAVQPDGTVGGPNYAWCETYVLITDTPFCECGGNGITLNGFIETETGQGVKNVQATLTGDANATTTSDTSGYYEFNNLQPGSYALGLDRDVFPKNGVTTLDILLISKHLLGIEPLGSPYKMIAADVNNDKKVTTLDLVHLRRLILGVDAEFVANTSWRFVPAAYDFPVPTNPWAEVFSDIPDLGNLEEDTQFDFIAIKIGDVNGSANTGN
ncbi:MAG: hypothetical protein HUU01_11595 [Saprospiraceae bacterium]|nr:hypothetical protein [Saprospiraceae bacterium]